MSILDELREAGVQAQADQSRRKSPEALVEEMLGNDRVGPMVMDLVRAAIAEGLPASVASIKALFEGLGGWSEAIISKLLAEAAGKTAPRRVAEQKTRKAGDTVVEHEFDITFDGPPQDRGGWIDDDDDLMRGQGRAGSAPAPRAKPGEKKSPGEELDEALDEIGGTTDGAYDGG